MFDLILVGGGLANGLIAYRLRQLRPTLRLLLVEQGEMLGGNHTWSFYGGDLSAAQHGWFAPFVQYRWDDYEVRFPAYTRVLPTPYLSLTSAHFHQVLHTALGADSLRMGARVRSLDATSITLGGGETLSAAALIDGRGPAPSPHLTLGYQKFSGRVVRLANGHGLKRPIIMDATVDQTDGYRFVYTLPLDDHELLIEDTCYSQSPRLDSAANHSAIDAYAAAHGWHIQELLRMEAGVLPITLAGDVGAYWSSTGQVSLAGLRALLFHASTGYSLPDAVRYADMIAALPRLEAVDLRRRTRAYAERHWRRQSYFRLLNRMLLWAADAPQRRAVMQRFYLLGASLIERFYAGQLTWLDRLRILVGKPPVPVGRALRCLIAPSTTGSSKEIHI